MKQNIYSLGAALLVVVFTIAACNTEPKQDLESIKHKDLDAMVNFADSATKVLNKSKDALEGYTNLDPIFSFAPQDSLHNELLLKDENVFTKIINFNYFEEQLILIYDSLENNLRLKNICFSPSSKSNFYKDVFVFDVKNSGAKMRKDDLLVLQNCIYYYYGIHKLKGMRYKKKYNCTDNFIEAKFARFKIVLDSVKKENGL